MIVKMKGVISLIKHGRGGAAGREGHGRDDGDEGGRFVGE